MKTETMYECKNFQRCSAPICPLDKNKNQRIWYSNEAICMRTDFSKLQFIKTQRKIKRKQAKGFFTYKMLDKNYVVRKGIKGLNPESNIKKTNKLESNWLSEHKGRPKLSKKQIEQLKERMKTIQQKRAEKSASNNSNNLQRKV